MFRTWDNGEDDAPEDRTNPAMLHRETRRHLGDGRVMRQLDTLLKPRAIKTTNAYRRSPLMQ